MPFPSPHLSPHPIVPPPELVQQWYDEARDVLLSTLKIVNLVATRAAQWGADQELEACCEWLAEAKNHGFGYDYGKLLADEFRAARRPKPPNLKEQALEDLEQIDGYAVDQLSSYEIHDDLKRRVSNIRRALEQLPE
jgi:hypothetical protein